MSKFIRKIFLSLLTFAAIPSFAHDYYAIPSGWEKVCEFDSSYPLLLKTSKNQLYLHNIGQYSQDGGKTFRKIDLGYYLSDSKLYFINGKFTKFIYSYNPIDSSFKFSQTFDLLNYKDSSLNVSGLYLDYIPNEYIFCSYNFETIIVLKSESGGHFGSNQKCYISRDTAKTWKRVENIPKLQYSMYNFIIDYNNPQRWLFSLNSEVGFIGNPNGFYQTEDNGYNFTKLDIDYFENSYSKIYDYYLSMSYFGSQNYFTKKSNYYYIKSDSLNQLEITNVYDRKMKTILSLDSIVADYSKLNNVTENSVNFSNIYFYTNDKGMLFQTFDQAKYLNKDTASVKLMYLDCVNQKVNVWQDFEIPLIPNEKNYSLPRILDYDRETGYVYVELCQPIAGLQKRVVFRKQIGTANSIETDREQTETITVNEGRIILTKPFENPEITVLDLLGKQVDFKILLNSPLTLQLNNQINGIYFLQVKDNLKQSNYKLMVVE